MDPTRRSFSRYNRTISSNAQPANMMCRPEEQCLTVYTLAMVYAPKQCFEMLYDPASALCHGTLFKELNLPFAPDRRY